MTDFASTQPLPEETFCPSCGYDLHALVSENCPECGWEVDRQSIQRESIPWIYRGEIGKTKAFFRTAWLASARPKQLAGNASRPVDYQEAQRFRWIVIFFAALPVIVAALVTRYQVGDLFVFVESSLWSASGVSISQWQQLALCFVAGIFLWPVPSIGILLFFLGVTGVGSYLYHPGWLPIVRQNRAVALSYYGCASLAFLFVAYVPGGIAAVLIAKEEAFAHSVYEAIVLLIIVALFVTLLLIVHWLYASARMLGASTHCTLTRQIFLVSFQGATTLLLAVLSLGVFPVLCGLVRILIHSV